MLRLELVEDVTFFTCVLYEESSSTSLPFNFVLTSWKFTFPFRFLTFAFTVNLYVELIPRFMKSSSVENWAYDVLSESIEIFNALFPSVSVIVSIVALLPFPSPLSLIWLDLEVETNFLSAEGEKV